MSQGRKRGWLLKGLEFIMSNATDNKSKYSWCKLAVRGTSLVGSAFCSKKLMTWFRGGTNTHMCKLHFHKGLSKPTALTADSMAAFGDHTEVLGPGLSGPNLASKSHPLSRLGAQPICPHWGWVIMKTLLLLP